ncbi:hypothetical protein [Olsenella profusa]|uniref:DUF340 domain-containing protein n=1 Tax=Olsenella profusa TaxID=138595 RepID=A0ABS2F212_9ACTN|nr:hypothetical protein [Olsenella profusa]MBM6774589.1 hypothetical protein [Olsenella profusa]
MLTIALMCVGAVVGRWAFPRGWARANARTQTVLTALLIFTMGVTIGSNDELLGNLGSFGLESALFCLVPTALSVALVYALTRGSASRREGE